MRTYLVSWVTPAPLSSTSSSLEARGCARRSAASGLATATAVAAGSAGSAASSRRKSARAGSTTWCGSLGRGGAAGGCGAAAAGAWRGGFSLCAGWRAAPARPGDPAAQQPIALSDHAGAETDGPTLASAVTTHLPTGAARVSASLPLINSVQSTKRGLETALHICTPPSGRARSQHSTATAAPRCPLKRGACWSQQEWLARNCPKLAAFPGTCRPPSQPRRLQPTRPRLL